MANISLFFTFKYYILIKDRKTKLLKSTNATYVILKSGQPNQHLNIHGYEKTTSTTFTLAGKLVTGSPYLVFFLTGIGPTTTTTGISRQKKYIRHR